MKNSILISVSLVFIILIQTDSVYAQGIPGPPIFPSDPDPVPVDGGLGLLAAAGGAYAVKKLRDKNK
jgi:hypothetical protein